MEQDIIIRPDWRQAGGLIILFTFIPTLLIVINLFQFGIPSLMDVLEPYAFFEGMLGVILLFILTMEIRLESEKFCLRKIFVWRRVRYEDITRIHFEWIRWMRSPNNRAPALMISENRKRRKLIIPTKLFNLSSRALLMDELQRRCPDVHIDERTMNIGKDYRAIKLAKEAAKESSSQSE